MTRIAILSPSITTGDAVSNDVIGMYETLRASGHEARIYAEGWTIDEPTIRTPDKIHNFLRSSQDLLIYHFSRGWDFGLKLLSELKCRIAIKYHNVTPPEYLERFSRDFARMCLEGRDQLKLIANARCELFMSDSGYNAGELLKEGTTAGKSFIVPPFHHIDRLSRVEADPKLRAAYDDNKINILMVGRVAPNKGHTLLIEAFAAYHHDYNARSRLFIVGKEEARLAAYNNVLREMARYLKVGDSVIFTGEASESALKTYYSLAHVFMITSEHEGFCVPLVEAMSMNVPIVAYGSTAIPGTVDQAGLVWNEGDPYLLAESIHSIIKGNGVAKSLGEKGRRRYEEHFTNEKIKGTFLNVIGHLL